MLSQAIERATGGALCNPFPMGEDGVDNTRRELVIELHRRWLEKRTTPAKDMTLVGGGSLPVDHVQPQGDAGELTGEMAETQLKALIAAARRAGVETIRLECGPSCRAGRTCHGLELARLLRVLQSAALAETLEAASDDAEVAAATAQAMAAARAAEANKPTSKANRLQALLDRFETHVWSLVRARQRLEAKAREAEAAEQDLTVAALRERRRQARKAERKRERQRQHDEQLAKERAAGKRQRGQPRAAAVAAPDEQSAAQAIDSAEAGDAEVLRERDFTVKWPNHFTFYFTVNFT